MLTGAGPTRHSIEHDLLGRRLGLQVVDVARVVVHFLLQQLHLPGQALNSGFLDRLRHVFCAVVAVVDEALLDLVSRWIEVGVGREGV